MNALDSENPFLQMLTSLVFLVENLLVLCMEVSEVLLILHEVPLYSTLTLIGSILAVMIYTSVVILVCTDDNLSRTFLLLAFGTLLTIIFCLCRFILYAQGLQAESYTHYCVSVFDFMFYGIISTMSLGVMCMDGRK